MSELSRFAESIYFYYGPTRGLPWTYTAILLRYLPLQIYFILYLTQAFGVVYWYIARLPIYEETLILL